MKKLCGFTLLEILVALLILSIGLLGLASLQVTALRANSNALFRTQATNLSYMIVDNMRANIQDARNGRYNIGLEPMPACQASTTGPIDVSSFTIAEQDTYSWRNTIACTLPDSTGSIATANTPTGNTVVTITIRWNSNQPDTQAKEEKERSILITML